MDNQDQSVALPRTAQPTDRARILGALDEPARVKEIAAQLRLGPRAAAAQLCALQRAGEVARLARGVYVRADRLAAAAAAAQDRQVQATGFLDRERTAEELAALCAASPAELREILRALTKEGRVERVGKGRFRRADPRLPLL